MIPQRSVTQKPPQPDHSAAVAKESGALFELGQVCYLLDGLEEQVKHLVDSLTPVMSQKFLGSPTADTAQQPSRAESDMEIRLCQIQDRLQELSQIVSNAQAGLRL